MAKVALCVESHEAGFRICLAMVKDKTISTPAINKNIQVVVENRDHFTSNSILVKLLQPVVDAIGRLERAKTCVGDVWKELGTVYIQLRQIDLTSYPRFIPYKAHCIKVLHEQAKIFNEPIYILGFFLNPRFRQLAVSCAYPIEEMIKLILSVAKLWNYKKPEALALRAQVLHYFSGEGAFRSSRKGTLPSLVFSFLLSLSIAYIRSGISDDFPMNYWLAIPLTTHTNTLKPFAIRVHELVAHAGGVESLFSMMGATKTKGRGRMTVTNLKMISQVELEVKAEHASCDVDKEHAKNLNFEDEVNSGLFEGVEDLQEFEDGVFAQHSRDQEVDIDVDDGFIDSLFDFMNFNWNQTVDIDQDITKNVDGESDGESWDADDLCGWECCIRAMNLYGIVYFFSLLSIFLCAPCAYGAPSQKRARPTSHGRDRARLF